jgi:Transposase DDE domain
VKFGRNFIPAYNAQAVTTEGQIILAAEITTKGGDFEELDPMIAAAERELATAGVDASPGVVLADTGYWSNEHIDSLRGRGMIPIVAADTTRNRPRKTRLGGPYDFMRKGDRHRGRRRTLLQTPVHGRARLCPDQDEPPDRPLQTKGAGGRSLGMAPDCSHSQSLEAPPTPAGRANRLTGGTIGPCRFQIRLV